MDRGFVEGEIPEVRKRGKRGGGLSRAAKREMVNDLRRLSIKGGIAEKGRGRGGEQTPFARGGKAFHNIRPNCLKKESPFAGDRRKKKRGGGTRTAVCISHRKGRRYSPPAASSPWGGPTSNGEAGEREKKKRGGAADCDFIRKTNATRLYTEKAYTHERGPLSQPPSSKSYGGGDGREKSILYYWGGSFPFFMKQNT